MKKTIILNTLFFLLVMAVMAGVGVYFFNWSKSAEKRGINLCFSDEDCILFGETGDCNCGCYIKENLPTSTGGECYCLAPTDCKCVNGKCIETFEGEVSNEEMEESSCKGMSLEQAKQIASQSECGDRFKGNFLCNEITNTWWIDLDMVKEGCNPACVVNTQTKEAEINWRCTGLVQPE